MHPYVINPFAMRLHGIGNKLMDNKILGDVLNYRFICSTTRRRKPANTQIFIFLSSSPTAVTFKEMFQTNSNSKVTKIIAHRNKEKARNDDILRPE